MPVIEAPLEKLRNDAVSDLLLMIANRLPDDLWNIAGMAVVLMDTEGGVELHDCGLSHLQLIGLMEEAKMIYLIGELGGEEE